MAPRNEIKPLLGLAFDSIKAYLMSVCENLLPNDFLAPDELLALSERLRDYLYEPIVQSLHNRVGLMCLQTFNSFYQNKPSEGAKSRQIAEKFSGLIVNPYLEQIDAELSEPVAATLLQQLHELKGIRELNCSSFKNALNETENLLEKRLLDSCSVFANLTHFSADRGTPCSDATIAAISKHCAELQAVIVRSRNVTDACIESLIECKKLKCADLLGSGVTSGGLYRLLTETKSKTLTMLEFGHHTEAILALLNSREISVPSSFKNEHLRLDMKDMAQLQIITEFFPHIVALELDSDNVPDLSSLVNLKKLTVFGLIVKDIAGTHHRLNRFLQIAGSNITVLALVSFDDSLPPKVLMDICIQCPNVKQFEVSMNEQNDFIFHTPLHTESHELFRKLETLKSSSDSLSFAKLVMRHAQNIRRLVLSDYEISTEELFKYVLESNPLERLEYISLTPSRISIAADTFRSMIEKCEQLKRIMYVHDYSFKPDVELILSIQNFIKTNNYNVKLEPVDKLYKFGPDNRIESFLRPVKLDEINS